MLQVLIKKGRRMTSPQQDTGGKCDGNPYACIYSVSTGQRFSSTIRLTCVCTSLSLSACVCKMVKCKQRANMQFCFKLGKTAAKTHEIHVTAYGSDAVTRKTVFKRFQRFRVGNDTLRRKKKLSPVDIEKRANHHPRPRAYPSKPTCNKSGNQ
jgi:hypothetical protein